jgi:uncharacterized protein
MVRVSGGGGRSVAAATGRPLAGRKAAPRRTCVACRRSTDKRTLHRIVRSPDGVIRYDPTGSSAGRGAYLCSDPACAALAVKRRSLQRALKAPGAAGAETAVEALRNALGASGGAGRRTTRPQGDEGSGRRSPRSSDQEEVRTG